MIIYMKNTTQKSTQNDTVVPPTPAKSDTLMRKTLREIERNRRVELRMFINYPVPVFYGDETTGVFKTTL